MRDSAVSIVPEMPSILQIAKERGFLATDFETREAKKHLAVLHGVRSQIITKIKDKFLKPQGEDAHQRAWADLEPECRIFHIPTHGDASVMLKNYPSDSLPKLVAPFPVFKLKIDKRTRYKLPSKEAQPDDAIDLSHLEPGEWIVDARDEVWQVHDLTRVYAKYSPTWADGKYFEEIAKSVTGEYEMLLFAGPISVDPETCAIGNGSQTLSDEWLLPEGGTTPSADAPVLSGPHLARAFCAFANHRDVSAVLFTDPERPMNRQQRRAQNYQEREHYRIVIRGRPERIGLEIGDGKNVRERREHEVRGHLRYMSSGRIATVRPHRRCRESAQPFIQREYELAVQ